MNNSILKSTGHDKAGKQEQRSIYSMGFKKTITKQTENIWDEERQGEMKGKNRKSKKRCIEKEDYLLALFTPSLFSVSSYMDKLTVFLYLYRMRIYENKTNLPKNRR